MESQLDELEPRAGCEPETGRPTRGANPVGPDGPRGHSGLRVHLSARGRWPLGHPDPLTLEVESACAHTCWGDVIMLVINGEAAR